MTAMLFALGLSLSDATPDTRYVPVKTYIFRANSEELAEAKERCELIELLAQSIDDRARHQVNAKIERRIAEILKRLLKEKR